MYELIDGMISIASGIYALLAATGKIQIGTDEGKSKEWILRHGKIMQIVAPILIIFDLLDDCY